MGGLEKRLRSRASRHRRHAERPTPGHAEQRDSDDRADRAFVGGDGVLVPGIVTQAGASADIQVTPQMTVFGGMGGRGNEGRMQVDGLNTGAALNGGGVSTYVADISNASEVVTTTSGGLGEAEVGGPRSASCRAAAATRRRARSTSPACRTASWPATTATS